MSYLLDTCVFSELMSTNPSAEVTEWMVAQPESEIYLSSITYGALIHGVDRLPPSKRRTKLESLISQSVPVRFTGRILPVDAEVAEFWGGMLARLENFGRKVPTLDSLIAATALVHDLTLVTRNVSDFRATGVKLFDPWTGKQG